MGASRFGSIDSEASLFHYTNTWRTICKNGLYYYSKFDKTQHVMHMQLEDFQLMFLEKDLVTTLKETNEADYKEYLYEANSFNRDLLQSNKFLHDNNEARKIVWELEKRFSILRKHPACEAGLSQLIQCYERFGFIKGKYDLNNIHSGKLALLPDVNRNKFCRSVLQSLLDFFSAVEIEVLNHAERFNAPEKFANPDVVSICNIIQNNSALELDTIVSLLSPKTAITAPQQAPDLEMASAPQAAYGDYKEIQQNIETINRQLSDASKKINPKTPRQEVEQFYKTYDTLSREREISVYLLSQRKKELSYINRAKEASKDYVKKNWSDKKGAAKAAGTVLAVKAGTRLAKAGWNVIKGNNSNNDWEKIGKDLAWDIGEAGLTGISTLIMGPVGGRMAGKLMGFFRPQPVEEGPYDKAFEGLNDKLDKGFDLLSEKINNLDAKLENQFAGWSKYVVNKVQLNSQIDEFKNQLSTVRSDIQRSKRYSDEIYEKNQLNVVPLIDLNDKIQRGIERMLQIFYNENYTIEYHSDPAGEEAKGYPAVDSNALYYKIINLYSSNDQSFTPFPKTCEELIAICARMEEIVSLYLSSRNMHDRALAGAMLYHTCPNEMDKTNIFWQLHDQERDFDDLNGELFCMVFNLKQLLIGERNLYLYNTMQEYWHTPKKFSFLSGFGLNIVPAKGPIMEQFAFHFEKDKFDGQGVFVPEKGLSYRYRYYIAPPPPDTDENKYETYNLLSFQKNETVIPIPVKVALQVDDKLKLYHSSSKLSVETSVEPLTSEAFKGSFEQFVQAQAAIKLDNGPVNWSLPCPGMKLRAVYTDGPTPQTTLRYINDKGADYGTFLWAKSASQYIKPVLTQVGFSLYFMETATGNFVYCSSEEVIPYLPQLHVNGQNILNNDGLRMFQYMNSLRILPFPNLMISDSILQEGASLVSENQEYTLKFDTRHLFDKVLNLYAGTRLKGSVFSKYTYRNNYDVVAKMQLTDGHFVLYDKTGYAVAASGIYGDQYVQAQLLLTNDGRLLLIHAKGALIKELEIHREPEVTYEKEDKHHLTNRLMPGRSLAKDEYITSSNNAFALKIIETDSSLFTSNKSYSLIHYKQPNGTISHLMKTNADVQHGFHIQMQTDGNLVMKGKIQPGRGNIVTKEVGETATGKNPGAFLLLDDDGNVKIMSADGISCVKQL